MKDQLCYEVAAARFISSGLSKSELQVGLVLILDYNEDRQTEFLGSTLKDMSIGKSFSEEIVTTYSDEATIIIESIGKY